MFLSRRSVLQLALVASVSAWIVQAPAVAHEHAPLRIGVQYGIDSFAPQGGSQWALVEYGVAETLTVAQDDGSVTGWLAESVTTADGKLWTIKLRDGVKFQNGNAVTAKVVVKALQENLAKNPEGNFMKDAKFAEVSPLEVSVSLPEVGAYVPAALAGRYFFPIYDADAQPADAKDAKAFVAARIYTGAFILTGETGATAFSLDANPGYWRGAVPTQKLNFTVIPSAETRMSALEAGDIDLVTEPPASAALKHSGDGPIKLAANPSAAGTTQALITHVLEGPTQDVRVRRAIGYAINYESIAKDVLNGVFLPANGLYGPSIAANKPNYEFNKDKAAALLEEAGWKLSDGKRQKDGAPLSLTFLAGASDSDATNIGVAMKQMLAEVGIELNVQTVADLYAPETYPKWHMLARPTHAWGINGSPIDAMNYSIGAQWGRGGQTDKEVARLSRETETTINADERAAILAQLQDRLLQEGLLYSLAFQPSLAGVSERLKDYVPVQLPMVQWDIGKTAQ